MRTETFWKGERQAARMHWWRQVLDRPNTGNWNEVFDEMVSLRFRVEQDEANPLETGLIGVAA